MEMTKMLIVIAGAVLLLFNIAIILWIRRQARGQAVTVSSDLKVYFDALSQNIKSADQTLREELSRSRQENGQSSRDLRAELVGSLDKVRVVVEDRLRLLQQDNNQKLDQMRSVVDEKLHATLEKRLGESFKLVSDRLELVHRGLGEMQSLAIGVGDLKKVLTNVKTRGIWGEIQLEAILDEMLTPEQYAKNIVTKRTGRDPVEFAIRLPGKNDEVVWLPIDAKFPKDDYERLLDAQDKGDAGRVEECAKALEARLKSQAKDIRDKYLDPPATTEFAILFVPIEGLYAEILRRPGLCELLRRDFRITVAGPTTISALLNSLQMGFRSLAIEKRAGEVWNLLGAVKVEFGRFGELLDKTHKQLQAATHSLEDAAKKTRTIEKKLKDVTILPVSEKTAQIEESISEETREG